MSRRNIKAIALLAPIILFLSVLFVYPVGTLLFTSVDTGRLSENFPQTAEALGGWNSGEVPEAVFPALAGDLAIVDETNGVPRLAAAMNAREPGFRSLLINTSKALQAGAAATPAGFAAIDTRWDEDRYWRALKNASARFTDEHLLASLDLVRSADGEINQVAPERRVYSGYLLRTITISLTVTAICLMIAYPIAYAAANATGISARLLMLLILLPFWTSLLVRSAAWVVVLQNQGIVNGILGWAGLIGAPIPLLFNRTGVLIGMIHVLLPFAVLPLLSTMRSISPFQLKAAATLGARPMRALMLVYLPQTLPGAAAAGLIVFILANGFYITPVLLGGSGDQLISALIADLAIGQGNWPMASALSVTLLAILTAIGGASAVLTKRIRA